MDSELNNGLRYWTRILIPGVKVHVYINQQQSSIICRPTFATKGPTEENLKSRHPIVFHMNMENEIYKCLLNDDSGFDLIQT